VRAGIGKLFEDAAIAGAGIKPALQAKFSSTEQTRSLAQVADLCIAVT